MWKGVRALTPVRKLKDPRWTQRAHKKGQFVGVFLGANEKAIRVLLKGMNPAYSIFRKSVFS
jgi:hypothetical protein